MNVSLFTRIIIVGGILFFLAVVYYFIINLGKKCRMKIVTNSFEETQQAGIIFAKSLLDKHAPLVILLFGDLGAGKTTFMQGLAKGLGITRRLISPTFIIVRKYEIPGSKTQDVRIKQLYHIDLYRTQTVNDLKSLGIKEILQQKDAIVAIEWPEKLGELSPKNRWEITFTTLGENARSIIIEKI